MVGQHVDADVNENGRLLL